MRMEGGGGRVQAEAAISDDASRYLVIHLVVLDTSFKHSHREEPVQRMDPNEPGQDWVSTFGGVGGQVGACGCFSAAPAVKLLCIKVAQFFNLLFDYFKI